MNKKIIIGILLISTILFNDFPHIKDWSSAELIGFNLGSLIFPILGVVLLIEGIKEWRKK
jgi:hypothetical protein